MPLALQVSSFATNIFEFDERAHDVARAASISPEAAARHPESDPRSEGEPLEFANDVSTRRKDSTLKQTRPKLA